MQIELPNDVSDLTKEQLNNLKEDLGPAIVDRKKDFKKSESNYFQISKKYEKLQTDQEKVHWEIFCPALKFGSWPMKNI